MITAPFNFVPLSEKVFFPNWADEVSHDVPFEDSQSGSIDITITAKSPIFIRNHYIEGDRFIPENEKDIKKRTSVEFCHHQGTPYIPSSSVKGMVRNVLEIMSFSKMSIFNDDTYAVRDLSKSDNFYMKEMKQNTYSGWLKKVDDEYVIEDCGIAGRISHEEIDKAFDVEFSKFFKQNKFNPKDAKEKTSEYKYNLLNKDSLTINVGEKFFSKNKFDTREFYKFNSSGKNSGTLVLTGQPTARKNSGKKGDGKGYEFIFFKRKGDISVDNKVMEKFLFAYFDKRKTEPKESPDWTYWKNKLSNSQKVPVFFQKDSTGKIKHIGLSYLYKLPYNHSVSKGIPKIHNDKRADLVETMFGHLQENNSLKGRIQFSHFKADTKELAKEKKEVVLGTPRASYYPIYVKQIENNLYTTFMNDDFSLSGRKRYPINTKIEEYPLPTDKNGKVNKKVVTTLHPMKKETIFHGKVRFHNLKKIELGALLSALTFHDTKGCFHNIGMAKPLGYGKIEVKIEGMEIEEYLKAFERTMNKNISDWSNQEQLTELISMATEQKNGGSSKLRYMDLSVFSSSKTNEYYLDNYTALDHIKTVRVKSLLSKEELKGLELIQKENEMEEQEKQSKLEKERKIKEEKKAKDELERKELEKAQKAFQKILDEVLLTDNLQVLQNFIEKNPKHEKTDEIKARKEQIEQAIKDDKYKKVNKSFDSAYAVLQKKKANQKQYQKEKVNFIKKWNQSKNNKGSKHILDLINKLK